MSEEKYRPFVVGAVTGCILWSITGGAIHAYVISPDWGAMGQGAISALSGWQPFAALVVAGFTFGLAVEIAKFIGAVFGSEGAVLFLPVLAGALVGVRQGMAVQADFWGFAANTALRSDAVRTVSGALCGLILSYPTVMIGIAIRRGGRPW